MNSLCQTVMQYFASNTPLVLATIMDQSGSAPRTAGARMLVAPDGTLAGTVGGGLYEAETIATALAMHAQEQQKAPPATTEERLTETPYQLGCTLEFSLQGASFQGDMDMVCGGNLTILLEYLPDAMTTRALFSAARAAEKNGEPFLFVTHIAEKKLNASLFSTASHGKINSITTQRAVILTHKKNICIGPDLLPKDLINSAQQVTSEMPQRVNHDNKHYLVEYFPQPYRVHIFGGGHVSLELANLTHTIGLHTTVLDDRKEFANKERFPVVQAKQLPSLSQADSTAYLQAKHIGVQDGIIIVTRGHAFDKDVLAAALKTQAGYIGMIGSKTKRKTVYDSLKQSGYTDEDLARVHSPIGLPIQAETPQEIAVSIAAELIQWRRSK